MRFTGQKTGTAFIKVSHTYGTDAHFISITITPKSNPLTLDTTQVQVYEGQSLLIPITNGNQGYAITSNPNIESKIGSYTYDGQSTYYVSIKGKTQTNDYQTLTIKDSRNKETTLKVQALPKIQNYYCAMKLGETCTTPYKKALLNFTWPSGYLRGDEDAQGNFTITGRKLGDITAYVIDKDDSSIIYATIETHILDNPAYTDVSTVIENKEAYKDEYVYIPMNNPGQYDSVSTQGGIIETYSNHQYIVFKGMIP